MAPLQKRRLGRTTLELTTLGCGGATLGDLWEAVPESRAEATMEAAYAAGIGYFDTAPWYGCTLSEHRFGRVLRTKPRDSFVLSTKVGRVFFRPRDPAFRAPRWVGGLPFDFRYDYTRDGVLRSYEDSLQRLGVNRVDALLIHDLDVRHHETHGVRDCLDLLDAGGMRALHDLKAAGEIRAVGAGVNEAGMIPRFLERFDLDFFLVAMPYTLLSQAALDVELPLCVARGVGVVIGAPFASGILATGPKAGAVYGYKPAEAEVLDRAARIDAVCRRHGVPLPAVALQFPLAHPAVASVIPGPNSPEQVSQNLAWMRLDIPNGLWSDLKADGLLHPDAPTP